MTDKHTKRAEPQVYGVYMPSMLTMKLQLSIIEVGKNIKQNLEKIISKKTEGKCITDGFIKPNSVKIVNYSSGVINGDLVEFHTLFECMVCHPVEGMLIECQTKTITKAGIHAEVIDTDGTIPVTVFIARDHHFSDKYFATITENAKITVQVIGVRFELNDPYICVIGKLVENRKKDDNGYTKRKPISILGGDADFEYENHDDDE